MFCSDICGCPGRVFHKNRSSGFLVAYVYRLLEKEMAAFSRMVTMEGPK